jgi:DNA helicase-2/ATP-dependent DNA helicase PcrA
MEESDGKMLTPLRFVSELDKNHILETQLPRASILLKDLKNTNYAENDLDKFMIMEAKRVLLEKGLSVTALNHFLECPSKFLYESILKMPQAPSLSAEKGSSMHEAVRRVWSQSDRSVLNIEKIIVSTITEYIDKSLLSPNDKISLKNELIENAKAVSSALFSHFNSSGVISTERWFEVPFDAKYDSKNFVIPIHGKLDVVIDQGDFVSVFDYKTKQGMSVSNIKGETKNGDGNYFRQLVFYKMLIKERLEWRTKKTETSLIFISPDEKGRCPIVTIPVEEEDVEKVKTEIRSLIDSIWSGKITTDYCGDSSCPYCGYRMLIK